MDQRVIRGRVPAHQVHGRPILLPIGIIHREPGEVLQFLGEVLVPRHPGVTSALGLLFADVTHDFSSTIVRSAADLRDGEPEGLFAEANPRVSCSEA